MIVPLFVGREKSVKALEHVMNENKKILLVTQKSPSEDDPAGADLYTVGTIGTILQLLKLPDGTVKVLVEGIERAEVSAFEDAEDFIRAKTKAVKDEQSEDEASDVEALSRAVITQFEQYVKLNKKIPPEVIASVNQIEEPSKMSDTIASHLALKIEQKQELLETPTTLGRFEKYMRLWKARSVSCKLKSVYVVVLSAKWRRHSASII